MRLTVAVAVACLIGGVSIADDARASIRRATNIPAQSLGEALQKLAKDCDVQVVYFSVAVDALNTQGATGEFTTDEAFKRVLSGTGLTYRYLGDKTITILPIAEADKVGAAAEEERRNSGATGNGSDRSAERGQGGQKASFWDRFRLAQVDQGRAPNESAASGRSDDEQSSKVKLEEIVVTAQKREERLMDVPISVVALNADDLAKRNITNIDDLAAVVPGLLVQDVGNQRRITLRGISNVFGQSSQIGVYLDEANITSTSTNQLSVNTYDLERVEVLRGPQGTLYGEGSMGGTIRFITRNPTFNGFDAGADMSALFTQDGAPTQRIEGMINVPLVEDSLAMRVTGLFGHEGGWIDQPAASLRDINERNTTDVRTKLLWQPWQQLTVNTMVEIYRGKFVPSIGEDANENYTQPFNQTTTPHIDDEHNLYNLTFNYDMGWGQLLNTATYFTQDNVRRNGGFVIPVTPPPSILVSILNPRSEQQQRSTNDELRLTSSGSGPWKWTIGGFYRDFHYDLSQLPLYVGVAGPPGTGLPAPLPFIFQYAGASKSWSVFGDSSYAIANRLTVGLGLRSYHDDEDYNSGGPQSASFHSVDPRFYVSLKLSDQVTAYASAAKGFRSGGFNAVEQPRFDPESVWTYEVGSKASLLDGGLSVDADLFYSKYKNYVVAGIPPNDPFVNYLQNAGNAVIKGVEFNAAWRIRDRWTIDLNGDYLDTYFTSINLVPASSPYLVGDNVDLAPKYQGTASAQRALQLRNHSGYVLLAYSIQGRSTFRNRSQGDWYFSESNVIQLLNFNAGIQWNKNLSLQLFAQNLLNDRGYTTPIVIEEAADRARPRTYGVSFAFRL
jgi:iron complex outermembrane receptor protein